MSRRKRQAHVEITIGPVGLLIIVGMIVLWWLVR